MLELGNKTLKSFGIDSSQRPLRQKLENFIFNFLRDEEAWLDMMGGGSLESQKKKLIFPRNL